MKHNVQMVFLWVQFIHFLRILMNFMSLLQGGIHRGKGWCTPSGWCTAKQKLHIQMPQRRQWDLFCEFFELSSCKFLHLLFNHSGVSFQFSFYFILIIVNALNGLALSQPCNDLMLLVIVTIVKRSTRLIQFTFSLEWNMHHLYTFNFFFL